MFTVNIIILYTQGTNAEFQLRLENLINSSSDLPFGISLSGNIILEDILDFEDIEYYLIRVSYSLCYSLMLCIMMSWQVIAEEESGANGTALIRIDVENRNDVDPVFEPDYYYVNISEGVAADAFIEQVICLEICITLSFKLYLDIGWWWRQWNIWWNNIFII